MTGIHLIRLKQARCHRTCVMGWKSVDETIVNNIFDKIVRLFQFPKCIINYSVTRAS